MDGEGQIFIRGVHKGRLRLAIFSGFCIILSYREKSAGFFFEEGAHRLVPLVAADRFSNDGGY
jgi:hypothetical protein